MREIIHGDCLEVMRKIPDNSIDIIFTSPPYNKAGHEGFIRKRHKTDSWKSRNIEYSNDATKDFMDEKEYQKWQIEVLNECYRILKNDGNVFYNHKVRIAQHKATHPMEWLLKTDLIFRQEIVWDRGSTPAVSPIRFLPTTELIFWLTKNRIQPNFNRVDSTTEVIRLNPAKNNHPAPFPEELVETIIKHCKGKIVLDPFAGSGTVGIVAKRLDKDYILIEREQEYIDIIKERLK